MRLPVGEGCVGGGGGEGCAGGRGGDGARGEGKGGEGEGSWSSALFVRHAETKFEDKNKTFQRGLEAKDQIFCWLSFPAPPEPCIEDCGFGVP